eukprot:1776595-Lingulodinium_polyedra.AAC.1
MVSLPFVQEQCPISVNSIRCRWAAVHMSIVVTSPLGLADGPLHEMPIGAASSFVHHFNRQTVDSPTC